MIRVLFDLKKEYYFNSLFPLYRELAADPGYELTIRVGRDDRRAARVIPVSDRSRIENRLLEEGYTVTGETSGFDVVVCGDALKNPVRYGDVLRIHVDHGMGIKTLRIRNIVRQKDVHYHVFLEGRYWYDYIKSLGWENRADFHITGIPKLDPFFWEGYYDNAALTGCLNLDPGKKTVLFAPSYKPSCIRQLRKKITDLLPDYNLIVKLHPYSWGGKYASSSQYRDFIKLARRWKDVYLIPREDYDIYPYLFLADTVISDTSSVINEFLALGRHGVIYVLPFDRLKHSDGMPVLSIDPEVWMAGAFPHMHNAGELRDAVASALNPTDDMKRKLKEYRDYFFTGLDGRSGKRVKVEMDALVKGSG